MPQPAGSPNTIALVITTYNRKGALELVLDSVMRQRVPPTEVIVADDGSRDDTAELVRGFQNRFLVPLRHVCQEDQGFRAGTARNKGTAVARSEYIVFLDGDMVLDRDFIDGHRRFAQPGTFVQGSRVMVKPDLTEKWLIT